jgi:hypothetical protein
MRSWCAQKKRKKKEDRTDLSWFRSPNGQNWNEFTPAPGKAKTQSALGVYVLLLSKASPVVPVLARKWGVKSAEALNLADCIYCWPIYPGPSSG